MRGVIIYIAVTLKYIMSDKRLSYLFKQCIDQAATEAELAELKVLLQQEGHKTQVEELFTSVLDSNTAGQRNVMLEDSKRTDILDSIFAAGRLAEQPEVAKEIPIRRISGRRKWLAAASVLLIISIGAYLWNASKKTTGNTEGIAKTIAIAPGSNGAILTLANGTTVVLDSLANGLVATQNGSQVVLNNGQLVYNSVESVDGEPVFNTMTTPKGRQFKLTLPDGSQVWLNASSSIRYPTIFTGNERTVEVTGEVYFEVAKNKQLPFRVNVNSKAEVEVLGTHFNINSYNNEPSINTTLLEGSVRVSTTGGQAVLKPGEEAKIATDISVVKNVDTEKVMAWKNGIFNFEGLTLREMMRQIERWYDIEVVYEDNVPNIEFFGKMSRNTNLDDVLIAMKGFGLKCRITKDRQLFVGE